jgi:hypothetical protein
VGVTVLNIAALAGDAGKKMMLRPMPMNRIISNRPGALALSVVETNRKRPLEEDDFMELN